MKWEINNNKPKRGEVRFNTRFAWLPTRVLSKLTNTDHIIWLEMYIEEQEYKSVPGEYDYFNGKPRLDWCTVAKTIYK
jgi:hypothetical protein